MPSAPPTDRPTMYCRKCWYDLHGLNDPRCPECGHPFDPARPRTYRTVPRRRFVLGRLLRTLVLVCLLIGTPSAWLYWQCTETRRIALRLGAAGTFETVPRGPEWLADGLTKLGLPPLETIVGVRFRRVTNRNLETLNGLTRLSEITLSKTQLDDVGLHQIPVKPSLNRLSLDGTRITDEGLAHVARGPNLSYLDIANTQVTDAGLAHIARISTLRELWLIGTRVSGEGLAHLTALPELQSLGLDGGPLSERGVANLSAVRTLVALSLHGESVTDQTLEHVKALSSLEELVLMETAVSPLGLVSLQSLRNLESLYLIGPSTFDNRRPTVTDDWLAAIRPLTKLRTLSVVSWTVSDRGLDHLASLVSLRALIVRAPKVTEQAIADLRRALPNCDIKINR